jgi:hypothetical protein
MDQENKIEQSSDRYSHLFTVRLWHEPAAKERMEIRGKVQHVLSGEVQYFRDWVAMEEFMVAQMDAGEVDSTA